MRYNRPFFLPSVVFYNFVQQNRIWYAFKRSHYSVDINTGYFIFLQEQTVKNVSALLKHVFSYNNCLQIK